MTEDKRFKKKVRERMARTGETYQAARAHMLSKSGGDADNSDTDVPDCLPDLGEPWGSWDDTSSDGCWANYMEYYGVHVLIGAEGKEAEPRALVVSAQDGVEVTPMNSDGTYFFTRVDLDIRSAIVHAERLEKHEKAQRRAGGASS